MSASIFFRVSSRLDEARNARVCFGRKPIELTGGDSVSGESQALSLVVSVPFNTSNQQEWK